ncbi:MAG: site-2 protease family protein [Clostridium sp.]
MKKWIIVLLVEFLALMWIVNFKISVIVSFLWIILHEIAHIIMAKKYGCTFNKIDISIWGVKADLIDFDELLERDKLKVYLAGPFFNIIMGIFLFGLNNVFKTNCFKSSIIINMCLGLFNLLPAYPLDGARILEILLSKKILYRRSKKLIENISFIISGVLFILFNIMLLLHNVNISLFLASVLMGYTTFLEKEKTMYIIMGDMVKKVGRLKKYNYMENKSISVYYKKGLVNVLTLVDKNKFNSFYILDDEMKLITIIHEDELIMALKEYGNITLEDYIKIKNNH